MRWFRRKSASEDIQPATAIPSEPETQLWSIRLDDAGNIQDMTAELRNWLPASEPAAPRHLSSYLIQPAAELQSSPQHWPAQLSSLIFQGRDGEVRYFQGGLFREMNGWRVCLLDNSPLMHRVQQNERRQLVLDFSVSQAAQMRQAHPAEMRRLTEDWLEGLVLRLQIPWLGLMVPAGHHWRLYASAALPWVKEFPWASRELQQSLINEAGQGPVAWVSELDGSRGWLVPYREHDGVRSWLIVAGVDTEQHMPFLSGADWIGLLMLFAAPLSSGLRYQAMLKSIERSKVLQKILESGWWEYRPSLQQVCMSPSFAESLGLTLDNDDCIGLEQALSVLNPVDRMELRERIDEAVAHGVKISQVVRMQTGETTRWFRIMGEASGAGDQRMLIGFAMNVNDLRQKEAEATAARARLEGVVDKAPAVIYVQRYHQGVLAFEFCSASLRQVLGWELVDLQSETFSSFVHPDDREIFYERTRALLQWGYASCRYRLRDRGGAYHWMLDEGKLLRDEQGEPTEVVGLYLDVTEATESSELVRKSEERYRILVEDSPAIICRYLPDLTLTFANKPLAEFLRMTTDSVVGINLGDFLSPADRQAALNRLVNLTPDEPVGNREICLQLPGNRTVWWVWADRGLFDEEGQLVEVQAVGRDNTEVHSTRRQLYQSAKMATLGEMATGLAHEINQPLTVMRMALTNILKRLGKDALTDDYLKEKLTRVENQVTRASKIVDHMRIFGRQSEIRGVLFDPLKAIEGALSLISEGMEQEGVRLDLDLSALPQVQGHGDRLEQVLINLLLNAQYSALDRGNKQPGHAPRVGIVCHVVDHHIEIVVEDNGGGIDPDMLDRIFEPFVTTKPIGKGTGLGLSVSYGIIVQMRGELLAENSLEGACFIVRLPPAPARQDESQLEVPDS